MRKISFENTASDFKRKIQNLKTFLSECSTNLAGEDAYISNCYEYGIINLYKSFEHFMYRTIVGCINHDSSHVSNTYNINFGKHISDDMCDFILTKD